MNVEFALLCVRVRVFEFVVAEWVQIPAIERRPSRRDSLINNQAANMIMVHIETMGEGLQSPTLGMMCN